MELFFLFSSSFLVGLSGAMFPGPVTIVLTRQALKRGLSSAPLITLGHGLLELLMLLFLFFGLGTILQGRTAGLVGLLGGIILIWMGQGMIRSPQLKDAGGREKAGGQVSPVLDGILATVSNPYWFLWWGTIGASYLSLSQEQGLLGILSFFTGHLLSDFLWLTLLALALVTGKGWMTDRFYRNLMQVLGFFLILLALYFFFFGVRML